VLILQFYKTRFELAYAVRASDVSDGVEIPVLCFETRMITQLFIRSRTMTTVIEEIGETLSGSCLCKATTYAFPRPPQDLPEDFNWEANYVVPGGEDGTNKNKWAASHCYCDSCQASAGTLVATWFSIPRKQFKLRKAGPTTVYKSSNHATREFVGSLRS
jgi:hypothetical protein